MARLNPFFGRKTNSGKDIPSVVCAICLDTITNQEVGRVSSSCNHLFCASCILQWFNSGNAICPLDRRRIRFVFVYKNIKHVNYLHGYCGLYARKCRICRLSINLMKAAKCAQCLKKFHYSCMGLKDGGYLNIRISQYICPICTKKPVHRLYCTCVRCCAGDDPIKHLQAVILKEFKREGKIPPY